MISLPDREAISAAPQTPPVLATRISQNIADGLEDLTHILVVHEGDTEEAIVEAIGWSPLIHPIEEHRYGDSQFEPYWDWLKDHGGWFELHHSIGTGFAYILFVEDTGDGELQTMCRRFAS